MTTSSTAATFGMASESGGVRVLNVRQRVLASVCLVNFQPFIMLKSWKPLRPDQMLMFFAILTFVTAASVSIPSVSLLLLCAGIGALIVRLYLLTNMTKSQ